MRYYCQKTRHEARKGRVFGGLKSGVRGFESPVAGSQDSAFPVRPISGNASCERCARRTEWPWGAAAPEQGQATVFGCLRGLKPHASLSTPPQMNPTAVPVGAGRK